MRFSLKRILCALLAGLMLIVTGCGSDETAVPPNTTPETVETVPAETEPQYAPLPDKDMDGWTMRYLNYDNTWLTWATLILVADEQTGDTLNDAVYERNSRISEQYNCAFSETTTAYVHSEVGNLVQSGDAGTELFMIHDENILNNYLKGYFQHWNVLPYVDFEAEYWNKSSTETFSNMGNIFAATGDFSLAQSTRSFTLLFNKDMYADLGLTKDLYQLAQDGKWTLDVLLEMETAAIADLDGDGVMTDKDRYGTAGAIKLYFGSLVTGAGIKYFDIDAEGKPYFAIPGNEHALNVMSDLITKHNGNNIYYRHHNEIHSGSNEARDMFMNNQILFCGSSMRSIGWYREMESDIGILPFPKYSEDQESYYALTSGGTVAALPLTLNPEYYENVGIVLEALCRDSHTGVIPLYKETLLKSRYARDEGSSKMLDIIFASATYDIGLSVFPQDTYYKYMEPYLTYNDVFVSQTQKITSAVESKLADMLAMTE